ncbi:hypothetical protein OHD16_15570 [Sphingobacterium sp. ML3W]|uniref:hypothetical protein n=1 Tax=Sphingobacterium sp. ML3W TaxID=1538644 RepID=UPI00249A72B1|nr:hypothetical protein [Sphingobacterium sp. ML3W]WFA81373.1 hypothetical protein OGI71_08710 [Sphingobacterium sp. ML3W]
MATKRTSWLRTGTLTVLGLGLVYGAQSFTDKEKTRVEKTATTSLVDQTWYNNEIVNSDPTNPANYALTPKYECGDKTEEICSIKAPSNGSGQPDMSHVLPSGETVQQQIEDAVANTSTNTTVQSFRSNK